MLSLFESIAYIPKLYYGALLGIGFFIYYLCEVVKVSKENKIEQRSLDRDWQKSICYKIRCRKTIERERDGERFDRSIDHDPN